TLKHFLYLYSAFMTKEQRTHFREDFPPEAETAADVKQAHDRIMAIYPDTAAGRYVTKIGIEVSAEILEKRFLYGKVFMRILERTARRQIPRKDQLTALRDAMNEPISGPIKYWGSTPPEGKLPYDSPKVDLRQAAETLLAYLNMTDGPGPVH